MKKFVKLNLIFVLFLSLFFLGGCKKQLEIKGNIIYSTDTEENIADVGAKVFLVKEIDKDLNEKKAKFIAKAIMLPNKYYVGNNIKKYNKLGIYAATTDVDGSYSFKNVTPGTYSLVYYSGFARGKYTDCEFFKYYNSEDGSVVGFDIPLSATQAYHYGFKKYGSSIYAQWTSTLTKFGWKTVTIEKSSSTIDTIDFGKSTY